VLSQTRKKIKAQESNRQQAMLEQSSNNDSNPNCYSGNAPAPEKKQKNRKYRQQQAVEAPLERKKKPTSNSLGFCNNNLLKSCSQKNINPKTLKSESD
jgi:hypothetical protein